MTKNNQLITFLSVFLLLFGIASGITLLQQKTIFRLRADSKTEISDFWITNVKSNSATITWRTTNVSTGFVKWKEKNSNFTKIAVPKSNQPKLINSVELEQLNPSTLYEFSISVNKENFLKESATLNFKTAQEISEKVKSKFIKGKILSKQGEPIKDAFILVKVSGSNPLSTVSDNQGMWSIDISQALAQSLSNYIKIDDQKTLLDIQVYFKNFSKNIQTTPSQAQNLSIFLD
ncbi:MAG: fibronectin type III domain-containing protein [Patescibacteria group bacterium]|nr:fibronectin type III domain-containing protein [Patescibacteria group bacterium]